MLFLVLVTSTKHYWIISAERRREAFVIVLCLMPVFAWPRWFCRLVVRYAFHAENFLGMVRIGCHEDRSQHNPLFGLTTYPYDPILRLNVYPRSQRTAGTLAGYARPTDFTHFNFWLAARTRDCSCDSAILG